MRQKPVLWAMFGSSSDGSYGHEIAVAAAEDLLELKKAAGRDKDQAHIAALERFLKERDRP